ncbi:uncharacterized protein I303_105735 [Kwoniella dejecticola CBS 10117]|uniref:alpha-L-rhamnosidase n=1 Tax=Kwoniella dejecticola CBS 10117 TaxID=1296121 RepID=A0A1A6A089_9TREE|nr:uncharacterized protein I303_05757 [Kwoniella dejecticola CBS 10117]OBR83478.1 hypothetical protein I303_05757 [Kwoniella dejecticola CBS 10117]
MSHNHSPITICALKFDISGDGLVNNASPSLSWKFQGDVLDWYQISCDIRIDRETGEENYHFDTSKSLFIPWPSTPLHSREIAKISIRSNGRGGEDTPWFGATVEAGLLERSDWIAEMITSPFPPHTDLETPSRPFLLHKEFHLSEVDLAKPARLYATAFGIYEITINGVNVGTQVLKPGWTSYDHRIYYQICDVSTLLRSGPNVIEGYVAEGWFSGRLGFLGGKRNLYGDKNGLLAQIVIDDEVIVKTDSTWTASQGPILSSGIYDGELFDVTMAGVRAGKLPVDILPSPGGELILDMAPIRRMEEIVATELIVTPSGKKIVDFGQNLVGWIRMNRPPSDGTSGDRLVFSHAEVLENGELGVRPLRVAKCQDTIILGTDNSILEGWEPKFTFHGFRYLQVDGYDDGLGITDFTAIVVHTDMERTGWFTSSHPMINRLHENVVWGMKGNFVGVPTDCPQRDERLGWTGDQQVFSKTANFLYDTTSMLSGWLQDLAIEQAEQKDVPPLVVPDILAKIYPQQAGMTLAIWGDAAVLVPLSLYEASGKSSLLVEQYESMFAWLSKGIPRNEDGLWGKKSPDDTQLGDWLDPAAPPDFPGDGRTDPYLVANAYLVHVTRGMAEISRLLNREEEALRFEAEWQDLRQKYIDNYVSKTGRTVSDSQTALALSLHFDLLSESQRPVAVARLEELVKQNIFKVATGFAGTPIILDVLAANDRLHLAYRMLQEKQCPSWLYCVDKGATTMWERWDSMRPDGSINPGEMTSFNHYALGAVASFLHGTIGGLTPLEPGWKKFRIAPRPGGTVTSAEIKHLSPYGMIRCSWKIESDNLKVAVCVPPNTRAQIDIGNLQVEVGSGKREFEVGYVADPRWPPKPIYHSMTIPLIDEIA